MNRSFEDDIDLIERYFENSLSDEERENIAQRLQRDSEFRKVYEREKVLVSTIRIKGAAANLEYLRTLEKSLTDAERKPVDRRWYYLAAAASVTILALVLWTQMDRAEPEKLYAQYFEPHANIFEPLVRGESTATTRTRAFQAYEQGDYRTAANLFSELLQQGEDPGVLMLLGNSYLMLGETEKAKQNFRRLLVNHDDLDIAATWYLSLAHVKDRELVAAAALLQGIKDSRSPYSEKARALLEDLK